MSRWCLCFAVPALAALVVSGCGTPPESGIATEIAAYALDDATGVIDAQVVELDAEIASDGGGSLRVVAGDSMVVRLFEAGDVDVENTNLSYTAMIRTEGLAGSAYLEMWCVFPNMGEYLSRALESPASGDSDWTRQATAFLLQEGQNPSNVRLNLVIDGVGTVWIDDLKLAVVPFPGT